MKILLTGPTGFIGSAFLRLALERGHEVAALVRPEHAVPAGPKSAKNCSWFRGTLADAPWRDIAAFGPEVCVHTAWISTPGVYLDSPENERFVEWSREFGKRAVEAGVRHVIVLGTCIEYQITRAPLAEDRTPVLPTTTYARCKHELHSRLQEALATEQASLCWARVFYPYGPGEHPSRLCSSLVQSIRRGQPVTLKTPDSTKDYIYIDDLARALLLLVERSFAGAINLGTGEGVTVRQIAERIEQLLGRRGLVEYPAQPAPDPFGYMVADATKLRALGWRPEVNLESGLARLVQALQNS
ncbi:MAG: NAD(P)-dependent oxidoreductase [Verrucomicrobia bacterium]|nr:NAD(P)-dependent oxidoreductase [Verrucomicrobiota bacterium]